MSNLSDARLVGKVLAGETGAYGELVARYENTARVVALRWLHHHHAAEDAVQQAFLAAFEGLTSLRNSERFGSWLLRIVEREAQNQLRRTGRTEVDSRQVAEIPSQEPDSTATLEWVVHLLNQLPEHERIVMSLHYLDGYSTPEISRMTGRPVGTITKQLSRAMQRLQAFHQERERAV